VGYVPEKYLPVVPNEENEVGGEETRLDDAPPPPPSEPGTTAAAAVTTTIAAPVASSPSLAATTDTNPSVPTEEYTPSPTLAPMVGKEAPSAAAIETHSNADSSCDETTAAVTADTTAAWDTTRTREPSRQFSLGLMDMDTVMDVDVDVDVDMDDSDDNDDGNDDENVNTTHVDNENDTNDHYIDINDGVNDDDMI
jgi:hypothetical protein